MAIQSTGSDIPSTAGSRNYGPALAAMVSLFFLFGFVTVLNDILIPHLKGLFDLTNTQAMLVQFCFFGAYFIMSVPAGMLLSAVGYQRGIVLSLLLVAAGLLLFIPASIIVSYPFFLFALFVIGSGITVLQVAANPYLSLLGPVETGSTRINLAGGLNSLAATVGPIIGAYFIFISPESSPEEKAAATRIPYMGLAVFVLMLAFIFSKVDLPKLSFTAAGKATKEGSIFRFKNLWAGTGAIFAYVGAEVAVGSIIIGYLALPQNGSVPAQDAARYVSLYWGGAMVGRFLGFALLSKIKTETTLLTAAGCALSAIAVAFFFEGTVSVWALVSLGLFHSVMWPCIFPLSIRGLGAFTEQGSGYLIMMVVGGALIPLLQGAVIDAVGYRLSFLIEGACYLYIAYFVKVASDGAGVKSSGATLP